MWSENTVKELGEDAEQLCRAQGARSSSSDEVRAWSRNTSSWPSIVIIARLELTPNSLVRHVGRFVVPLGRSLARALLLGDPGVDPRLQDVERQRAREEHRVVEATDVEARA